MYFMLILVSGAKMHLPLQLGVTDKQTDSTTTVTLCACALRVNNIGNSVPACSHPSERAVQFSFDLCMMTTCQQITV